MNINEIRRISLEYAKGNMATRGQRERAKVKASRRQQTYSEWFARSLEIGRRAGPPPHGGN